MVERFGDTPLRTHTPSGGVHLWYRCSGEGCANLRRSEGFEVDIKGIGGQVVVPPSVRFTGAYAGRSYGFLAGSWDDLKRLPTMHPGALIRHPYDPQARDGSTPHPADIVPAPLRAVKEGYRNNVLFCSLLRQAKGCDEIGALLDAAETINADFDPPLPATEVAKTAVSAWGYQTTGRNWVGKEQRVYTLVSELDEFASCPDALVFLLKLRAAHWNRPEFAVSPKAMAREQFIPGWTDPKRYRRARDATVQIGKLRQIYRGGHHQHDPSLFMLSARAQDVALSRGPETVPNLTKTPSFASSSSPESAHRPRAEAASPDERLAKTAGGRQ
jgi:hypothetical protein